MTSDHTETLVQLSHARKVLQSQLAHAEFDEKLTDSSINTISLIVRTLEKIDQLSRALLKEQKNTDDELSEEDFEKLKGKVEHLLKEASQRKQS
jgi:L-cysteine desulfidase